MSETSCTHADLSEQAEEEQLESGVSYELVDVRELWLTVILSDPENKSDELERTLTMADLVPLLKWGPERIRTAYQELNKIFKASSQTAESRPSQPQADFVRLNADHGRLRSEYIQLREALDHITEERDRLEEEYDDWKEHFYKVRSDRDELHRKLGRLKNKHDQLKAENNQLRAEYDKLNEERDQVYDQPQVHLEAIEELLANQTRTIIDAVRRDRKHR
jgi:chromosome segregation ATPase